jgi:phospholipid/cholesterol/gamma-HCH transport system ATP-binding protein
MTLIDGCRAPPARRSRSAACHKAFGPKRVLQGLDLDIPAGRSLVVIGGSGTGKSVLIKCVQALVEPDSGSIRVDGDEVVRADSATMARVRAKFGMLFQGGALFDSLPVWENVAFGLLASRRVTSRKEARSRRSPRWPW